MESYIKAYAMVVKMYVELSCDFIILVSLAMAGVALYCAEKFYKGEVVGLILAIFAALCVILIIWIKVKVNRFSKTIQQ